MRSESALSSASRYPAALPESVESCGSAATTRARNGTSEATARRAVVRGYDFPERDTVGHPRSLAEREHPRSESEATPSSLAARRHAVRSPAAARASPKAE